MRQMKTKFLIFLSIFVFGLAAIALWAMYRHDDIERATDDIEMATIDLSALGNIPSVNYCELASNPDPYAGKVIRVHGPIHQIIHGLKFFDPKCTGVEQQIAITFHTQMTNEDKDALDWRKVAGLFDGLDSVSIGRFKKVRRLLHPSSDSLVDTAPFHFEIVRIEKIEKVR
jgi:hypothetical protein